MPFMFRVWSSIPLQLHPLPAVLISSSATKSNATDTSEASSILLRTLHSVLIVSTSVVASVHSHHHPLEMRDMTTRALWSTRMSLLYAIHTRHTRNDVETSRIFITFYTHPLHFFSRYYNYDTLRHSSSITTTSLLHHTQVYLNKIFSYLPEFMLPSAVHRRNVFKIIHF